MSKNQERKPGKDGKPSKGVVVSDETLRRLQERKGRIEDPPKEPVKSA